MSAVGVELLNIEIGEHKEAIYIHCQNLPSAAGGELSSGALCGSHSAAVAVDGRPHR